MNAHKIFNLIIAFVFVFSLFGVPAPVLATSQASVQSASFSTCEYVTEIPHIECEALIALYNSTNGSGWVNHTDWLTTDTPCSWYGVECGWGHVTKLRLGANQLSGSIPMELGNLTQLTELGLGANQLSGSIPMGLGNLTQLTGLGLEFNQLTGSIPAELGNLVQLTWLNLAFNQLTGSLPTEIGGLTQLTGLYLVFNQLSGEFPSSITNLVSLTTLTFDCWLTSSDSVVIAFLNEKSAYQCAPNLQALPDQEQVSGENWTLGKTVTIEIDDPATQDVNPDHTGQAVVGIADWDPQKTWFDFSFTGDYNLKPGDLVTVSDNTTTKTHTVTSLVITNINPDTNMVSGTTNTGGSVDIWICDENNCVVRKESVDLNGNWSANFGEPGDEGGEEGTFDIQSYTWVDAAQYDQERDSTQVNWSVPNAPNPMLGVNPDGVWGIDWPLGASVTLTVDDPANGTGVDYTATETVQMYDFPNPTAVFHLPANFQIQPGFELTMTDGTTTKNHTVVYFEISNVDVAADIVSGVTEAGYQVQVWMSNGERTVTAGSDGIWSADFKIPGDPPNEDDIVDILPGDFVMASVHDADGDSTGDWANANTSTFGVNVNGYHPNWVDGLDWTIGELVNVAIDDPSTPGNPDAHINQIEVVACEFNPTTGCFKANFNGLYLIKVGDLVTVTQGTIAKTHEVLTVEITNVDPETDVVNGTTDPFSQIRVMAWPSFGSGLATNREVTADEFGIWSTDFTDDDPETEDYDLVSGTYVRGDRFDEDGDYTTFMEWIPYPSIQASVQYNWVRAMDWPSGAEVHLIINGQDFGSAIVEQEDPTSATFNLGEYELQIGDLVTMADGVQEKSITASKFEVTEIDTDADIVSGIGNPGAQLYVSVHQDGNNIWRGTTADGITGAWEVNFNGVVDIQVGSEGDAQERDNDGDSTWYEWRVPNPVFMLNIWNDLSWHEITAWNWPLNSQVTLSVDNPNTLQNPDYTEVKTMGPRSGSYLTGATYLQNNEFEGQPGFTITLSDGVQTKSMVVPMLKGTEYDLDADTVSGVTDPFASVIVACDVGAEPTVVADSEGNWIANFRDPQDPNIVLYDIQPGTWCEPQMYDDDYDHIVLRDWFVPIDTDGDGIADDVDNAPATFNPDQRDVDNDGIADVLDLCPADSTNVCNVAGSAAGVIGAGGGAFSTTNTKVSLSVPANALNEYISLSITDMGAGYELATDQGPMMVVHSYSIQPHGTHFDQLVTIIFRWDDTDNNGIVDGTTVQESYLRLIKDGLVITPTCSANPDCNVTANELTVHISDLSLFALAVPLNQPPVADAGGPYSGNEGSKIPLSASKSTDPENKIVLYEWDLDNDGQFDDATGKTPKFRAVDNGSFTVRVKVTDAGNSSSVDDAVVTVWNVAPIVTSMTIKGTIRAGSQVTTQAKIKDPGVNDTFTTVWKWGDGTSSPGTVSGNTTNGSHIYSKPGIYVVTITVRDDDGGIGQDYKLILVLPKR